MDTFAVLGGDLRCIYLAKLLADDGYPVVAAGFDQTELPDGVTGCSKITQAAAVADCVILPLPVTTDGVTLNAPLARHPVALEEVIASLQPRQLIFGGRLTEELGKQFTPHGLSIYDYFSREELAVQNAVPTAEGAIQLAMEELPITVRDARCLVTGYGRVAKALTRALTALGAHVTVAARRCSDRAAAQCEGCAAVTPNEIPLGDGYDVYFNTVPALLFPAEVLERLPKGALLIDLASRPGGVDFTAAAACGVRTVWAQSLPGRVAPKTAAAIIRRTVFNLIRELRGQEESL